VNHPVTFEDLADWLDGQLSPEALQRVEGHLAAGCAACQRDLAWLRRFKEAARSEGLAQPPPSAVAQVKAAFRARRPAPSPRLAWPHLPRLAALVVLAALAACLTLIPTVLARGATVSAVGGALEARHGEASAWQALAVGSLLAEGDRVRALGGTAELALFDGSRLELQPDAEVTLTSLRSGLFGIARQVALYQPTGTVRYAVQPLTPQLATFAVVSPEARVTVQGTRFVVTATGTETRVQVLEGTVMLVGALDSALVHAGEDVVAAPGARLRIGPRGLPAPTPQPSARPTAGPTQEPSGPRRATPTSRPAQPGPAAPAPGGSPKASPTPGPTDGSGPGPMHTPGPGGSGTQGPHAEPMYHPRPFVALYSWRTEWAE